MKNFIAGLLALSLIGCAGGPQFAGPGGQAITIKDVKYKDLVACKEVPGKPEFVDCDIKIGESGISTKLRFKISEVPLPEEK